MWLIPQFVYYLIFIDIHEWNAKKCNCICYFQFCVMSVVSSAPNWLSPVGCLFTLHRAQNLNSTSRPLQEICDNKFHKQHWPAAVYIPLVHNSSIFPICISISICISIAISICISICNSICNSISLYVFVIHLPHLHMPMHIFNRLLWQNMQFADLQRKSESERDRDIPISTGDICMIMTKCCVCRSGEFKAL